MQRTQTPWLEIARHVAQAVPLFWVVVGSAAAIGAAELALIVFGARAHAPAGNGSDGSTPTKRQRLSPWFAVAALAGPVLFGGLIYASIHIGRQMLLNGIASTRPEDHVEKIVAGLEASMNAQSQGLFLLGPILGLGVVAASLLAASTLNIRPARLTAAAMLFFGCGLGPFLWGAFKYTALTIKSLAGVAGVDVEMKQVMITKGFEETLEILDSWAIAGVVGFGLALVVAIAMVVRSRREGDEHRVSWWSPALSLIAAAGLFLAAEPMRAENTTPWPPSEGAAMTTNVVATPDVDGPDKIPPAEVVTVTPELTLFSGSPGNPIELRDRLVTMRNNYNLLHPGEPSNEDLVIICSPETATERLIEVLQLAKLTEYRRPAFAFGKRTTIQRPLLGILRRWQWSAAKALIPGVGPEQPTPIVTLTVDNSPTCDGVARAVAAIRRDGKIAGLAF